MPVYCFECDDHGVFDKIRTFAQSSDPANCPECGTACRRTFTTPNLAIMEAGKRTVLERNEKSRHEPTFRRKSACGHDHSAGGSCSHKAEPAKPKLKNYTGPRPWVIEHPR